MFVPYLHVWKSRKGYLHLFVSSRVDMGPHIREDVKKPDMYIELKSYKFNLLGKLVIQHSIHKII